MRIAIAIAACCLTPASAASASPWTFGASLGETEATADANRASTRDHAVADQQDVFARLRVAHAISLQAEAGWQSAIASVSPTSVRTGNLLAVLDVRGGRLVPIVLAGVGVDFADNHFDNEGVKYLQAELGAGLEYRFAGGLVLGADARIGTRTNLDPVDQDNHYETPNVGGLANGSYRSVRLTLGVRL